MPLSILFCYKAYSPVIKCTLMLFRILSYYHVAKHSVLSSITCSFQANSYAILPTLRQSSTLSCYQAYSNAIKHVLMPLSILFCYIAYSPVIKCTLMLFSILSCYHVAKHFCVIKHNLQLSSTLPYYPV
jgi:hypothetical protein